MKNRNLLFCFALSALALFGLQSQLLAQNNPLITIDEWGSGSINGFAMPGVMAPDPGPGGLASALTYDLLGPPAMVGGDVLIFEPAPGRTIVLSDILRCNPAGTGGNPAYPASLVFYSDISDGADAPADVGFPLALYDNTVNIQEVGPEGGYNDALYTPLPGQPCYVPGFSVTYHIVSDYPEPATIALIGMGSLVLIRRHRRA